MRKGNLSNMEIRDIIVFDDDKEYVIASKVEYNNKTYLYLSDVNNSGKVMFGYLDNDDIVEIKDSKLIKELLPMFLESSKDVINEIFNSEE